MPLRIEGDGKDIKLQPSPLRVSFQVSRGGSLQIFYFTAIHLLFRQAKLFTPPGFYFYYVQYLAVSRQDVNFLPAGFPVPFQDGEAPGLEPGNRHGFPQSTNLQVDRQYCCFTVFSNPCYEQTK